MIRLYLALGAVAVILGAFVTVYFLGAQDARDDLRNEIEDINNEAGDNADAAALGLLECLGADGVFWDFAAGECRRAE
jgi:hypothetical protein